MAFSSSSWSLITTSFFVILQLSWSYRVYANGCYTSIFSFGDSITDTGNFKHMASISHKYYDFLQPPYGETFFHQPVGRCSDGRLIIDFLGADLYYDKAESLGLPLIPPFLHDNVVGLGQGVNYAVIGAATLDTSFYEARGVVNQPTNASLRVQLAWFKQSLPSLCNNVSDCKNLFGRSLFLMGEFGGNDYSHLLLDYGKTIGEVEPYVPLVTDTIVSAISILIEVGAKTVVVQGICPLGCYSFFLTLHGDESEEYDNTTGCLISLNKFSEYHNQLLQTKISHLRKLHPNVTIIYADYYNAAMQIIRSPDKYGFTNGALKACCGGGGPYNYNPLSECGSPSATTLCDDPDTYVIWDGIHNTEAANRIISKSLFQGPYTWPNFNLLCPTELDNQVLAKQ